MPGFCGVCNGKFTNRTHRSVKYPPEHKKAGHTQIFYVVPSCLKSGDTKLKIKICKKCWEKMGESLQPWIVNTDKFINPEYPKDTESDSSSDTGSCASNETDAFSGGNDSDVEDAPPGPKEDCGLTNEELQKLLKDAEQKGFKRGAEMVNPKKAKKTPKVKIDRSEYAKANKMIKIGDFDIKTLSSFKFCRADVASHQVGDAKYNNVSCRFIKKDTDRYIEYCPWFCNKNNNDIKDYLRDSNTYQSSGTWSNSTKVLPKNWKFRENIDFFEYKDGCRPTELINKKWTESR